MPLEELVSGCDGERRVRETPYLRGSVSAHLVHAEQGQADALDHTRPGHSRRPLQGGAHVTHHTALGQATETAGFIGYSTCSYKCYYILF